MPTASSPAVVLRDLSFSWPDGSPALDTLTGSFGRGRTGLVGDNGVGKSTLLRLIARDLTPTSGAVATVGTVDHLPQRLSRGVDTTVADLLGVRPRIDALRRLDAGDASPEIFDAIGDEWDIEERSLAALAVADLPQSLDRPASALSGGEAMLVAIAGLAVRRADIALLDEPTNNLDGRGRERVYELARMWRGALIVVSHDIHLLELVDETVELRAGALRAFGGPYSTYRRDVESEQEAARRQLRAAEQALRAERRQRIEAEERIAHSQRKGRKDRLNRKYVGSVVDDRRNSAEKAQGAHRGMLDHRIDAAKTAVFTAEARVRDDEHIAIDLPDPGVASSRRIALLHGSDGRERTIQGPERVALTGRNGVGKTTLLRSLAESRPAAPGRAWAEALTGRIGYLSQHLDSLQDGATVLQNVARFAPTSSPAELRNRLARLRLRGAMVERPVGSLSGGERFRVALAQLLYADPPAQLLVLDEPTNDLDLASVAQLVEGLRGYRGALLVVSHDRDFLGRLELTSTLELSTGGRLEEVDATAPPRGARLGVRSDAR